MRTLALFAALALTACAPTDSMNSDTGSLDQVDPMTLGDSRLTDFYVFDGPVTAEPGTLLRQEYLGERQSNPGAAQNFRLLYSSTDGIDGEGTLAVSGVLFLPEGEPPAGGWPLYAWTHGTVGIADICAPSWDGRQQQDKDHLEFWLSNGFAVVASDYQGLGTPGTHPYLATRPEAYSNLDIIRAVQSSDFPVSDRVILAGQSQGAGAAVATAAYAEQYAPDVDIAGVVATGVPFFSAEALVALQESRPPDRIDPMLAYNFLALSLIQRTDPSFKLSEYVNEDVLPIAESVRTTCHKYVRARVAKEELTYNRAFSQSPSEKLTAAFSLMEFPSLKFSTPMFVGTGGKDRDTPLRMQAAFVKRACQAGSTITARLYPHLDHKAVVPGSTTDSLQFVNAAFAGERLQGNCDNLPY